MNPSHRSGFRARFLLLPLCGVVFLTVVTVVVHALWNGVLVEVTSVKPVSYWQALGLFVLAKILFGGFFGRGGRCGPFWKHRAMAEECASLPPEKREEWRHELRRRFGAWPGPCRHHADDSREPGGRPPEEPKS